jgi:hypothetical protein
MVYYIGFLIYTLYLFATEISKLPVENQKRAAIIFSVIIIWLSIGAKHEFRKIYPPQIPTE